MSLQILLRRSASWTPTKLAVAGRQVAFFIGGRAFSDTALTTPATVSGSVGGMQVVGGTLNATNSTGSQQPTLQAAGVVRVGTIGGTARGLSTAASLSIAAADRKGVFFRGTPSGASSTNPTTAATFAGGGGSTRFSLQVNSAGTHWRCIARTTASNTVVALASGKQSVVYEQTDASAAYLQLNGGSLITVSVGAGTDGSDQLRVGSSSVTSQSTLDGVVWGFWWGGPALTTSERALLNEWAGSY